MTVLKMRLDKQNVLGQLKTIQKQEKLKRDAAKEVLNPGQKMNKDVQFIPQLKNLCTYLYY